jgi:hypothetical protein
MDEQIKKAVDHIDSFLAKQSRPMNKRGNDTSENYLGTFDNTPENIAANKAKLNPGESLRIRGRGSRKNIPASHYPTATENEAEAIKFGERSVREARRQDYPLSANPKKVALYRKPK